VRCNCTNDPHDGANGNGNNDQIGPLYSYWQIVRLIYETQAQGLLQVGLVHIQAYHATRDAIPARTCETTTNQPYADYRNPIKQRPVAHV
jgi:hypothetical protein